MTIKNITLLILFYVGSSISAEFGEKKTFTFIDEPIDVVIPAINRGRSEYCIDSIKKYGKNIRNIYIISPKKVTDKAIWVDETIFPFTPEEIAKLIYKDDELVAKHFEKGRGRVGWYMQQMLKLYAPLVIPGISSNVLLLDSDVIFLNEISFMNEKSEPYFCASTQNWVPYFEHGARLLPGFNRCMGVSGIAHHMLIQRDVIENLFSLIESIHNKPAWQAIYDCVRLRPDGTLHTTGMSEFEIYFNYFFASSDQGHIRELKWKNVPRQEPVWKNTVTEHELEKYKDEGYVFISRH